MSVGGTVGGHCGLLHPVDGAVSNLSQIVLQKIVGDAVDALRLLKSDEVLVVTLGGKEAAVIGGHSEKDVSYGNNGNG